MAVVAVNMMGMNIMANAVEKIKPQSKNTTMALTVVAKTVLKDKWLITDKAEDGVVINEYLDCCLRWFCCVSDYRYINGRIIFSADESNR